jgi:hypothetical protein
LFSRYGPLHLAVYRVFGDLTRYDEFVERSERRKAIRRADAPELDWSQDYSSDKAPEPDTRVSPMPRPVAAE